MTRRATMFEPIQVSAVGQAVAWLSGALLGSVGTMLCVLAVAVIGLLMLTGRLPVRQGLRVVIGCFLLLGAPLIGAMLGTVSRPAPNLMSPAMVVGSPEPREDLPPADYDPYAGASLRRN